MMGDFNTLSRWDAPQHATSGLLAWITNGTAAHAPGSANHKHFTRLARKYATEVAAASPAVAVPTPAAWAAAGAAAAADADPAAPAPKELELAYGPMDALLDATGGRLTDLCALQCRKPRPTGKAPATDARAAAAARDPNRLLAYHQRDDAAARDPSVQACLRLRCRATEPTRLLPDRAELPPGVAAPPIRVDFLLANEPFLGAVAGPSLPLAEVMVDARTSTMSDHYPIRMQWTPKP